MQSNGRQNDEIQAAGDRAPERPRLSRRMKVLFSLITVLAALALLECASRVFLRITPNARWEYRCKRAEGIGFTALSDILMADDELFWKLKPNLNAYLVSGQLGNWPPIRYSVSTNNDGLRRMPPVNSARKRVLFLGDSCTFGLGVEDDQTFPALLQNRLKNVRCVNAAVPAYSAYQGRVELEQLRPDVRPDAVVITFGYNDHLPWDHLSDIEHAELIAAERSRFINRFRFVELLRQLLPQGEAEPTTPDRPPRPRLTNAEFNEQIRGMLSWCRLHGAEPILVVWPHFAQFEQQEMLPKQVALLRVARSEHVRLVNLVPVFRVHGEKNLFLDVVHASPAGCELIADTLLPILQEALEISNDQPAGP